MLDLNKEHAGTRTRPMKSVFFFLTRIENSCLGYILVTANIQISLATQEPDS
jgi:hypothetical protein